MHLYRHIHITQESESGALPEMIRRNIGNSEKAIRDACAHVIITIQTEQLFKDERGLEEDTLMDVDS